ncbi:unnamed protein product [Linum tenue]|uniref:Rx N-terminal domain-containing protein n=1 Tax=Linum tenue TaxID=586396 RepID=A0AAV0M5H6_9ROSI|nr:unnamed protein product [Linum tenue]
MIAELIGTPIRVDRATEIGARGNYARVSVEVDLTKPLLGKYKVEGITYLIQYEGLDEICGECGLYGNRTEKCSCSIMEEQPPSPTPDCVPETPMEEKAEEKVYGDWMTIKRKTRRYEQKAIQTNKRVNGATMGRHENRFHAFQEEEVRQTNTKATEKQNSETHARKNQQEGVQQEIPPSAGNNMNASARKHVPNNATTKKNPTINAEGNSKVGGKGVQAPRGLPVDAKVRDLISPVTDQWDWSVVSRCLPIEVGQKVVQIPLRGAEEKDVLIWDASESGAYTVREGYKVWVKDYLLKKQQSGVGEKAVWKKLWTLTIPPKLLALSLSLNYTIRIMGLDSYNPLMLSENYLIPFFLHTPFLPSFAFGPLFLTSSLPKMAFAVAEAILKKLAPLAAEQAGLLWSFKSDFLKLKSTVSSIRAVLLDADEQSGMNHQVRDWLDELKQVLYDADDLLDDFSTEALLKQRRNDGSRCLNEVCLFFTRSNQLVSGLVMAHRLKAIMTKLDEIDENQRKFNLETRLGDPAAAAAINHERQTDSFVPDGFVGREEDKKKIIGMLSSTNNEQKIEVGTVGSKVIVTTRLGDVANYMATKGIKPHKLKGLSEQESWFLFEQIAFKGEVEGGERFVYIGKEVMRSLFPKDSNIDVKLLVQIWMGQGFINSSRSSSALFEVGVEYFKSLLSMFFFQEPKSDRWGNVYQCKMHDLIHDVALEIASDEIMALKASNSMEGSVNFDRLRHISFDFEGKSRETWKAPQALANATKLRTFLFINVSFLGMSYIEGLNCEMIVSNNTRLRVLSLHNAKLESVPRSIHNLTHLRYLSLAHNPMKVLPDEITVLVNLQVLILDFCYNLEQLPRDIVKLTDLKFLSLFWCPRLKGFPLGIGRLTRLRELSLFIVSAASYYSHGAIAARISELERLDNLSGKLKIIHLELAKDEAEVKAASLFRKQHLQALTLEWSLPRRVFAGRDVRVLKALEPHKNLKELELDGYGGHSLPSWFSTSLQNLVDLKLYNLCRLKYIEDEAGQFLPCLKYLVIRNCPRLVSWRSTTEIEMPQFPSLAYLRIEKCPKLVRLAHISADIETVHLRYVDRKLLDQFAASLPPPSSPSRIKTLIIEGIRGLRILPQELLPHLASLEDLWIVDCPNLTNLSPPLATSQQHHLTSLQFSALPNLRHFYIWELPGIKSLPEWLQHSSNLQTLWIRRCGGLKCLPKWLPNLTALDILRVEDCHFLTARLKSRTAVDWPKVAHIRNIDINDMKVQEDGNYMRVEEPADENQLEKPEAGGEEEEQQQQQEQELFSEEDDDDDDNEGEEEEDDDHEGELKEEAEGPPLGISSPRMILVTYKHKTHAVDSDGKIISNADVDFYIDDDMIRVVNSKPVKRYDDFFLRQIVKLEGVIDDVSKIVSNSDVDFYIDDQ